MSIANPSKVKTASTRPIEMLTRKFNYFPTSYRDRGVVYHVAHCQKAYTTRGGKLFIFICELADGACVMLGHDYAANTWTIK